MSQILANKAAYAVTVIVALTMLVEYFFNIQGIGISVIGETLRTWAVIISVMALGLGAINLLGNHASTVQKRTEGKWKYSVAMLASFVLVFGAGVIGLSTAGKAESNIAYNWVFTYVYNNLSTTIYAITGFYIISAAYRAFRAKTLDATVLLISGCILMLTNAPIGETIYSGIPVFGQWLLNIGQVPAQRTFLITAGFGLLTYGFRTLTGKASNTGGAST